MGQVLKGNGAISSTKSHQKTKYPIYTQQKKFFDVIWDMGDFPENENLGKQYIFPNPMYGKW